MIERNGNKDEVCEIIDYMEKNEVNPGAMLMAIIAFQNAFNAKILTKIGDTYYGITEINPLELEEELHEV